jgi:hypothetical protein
MASFGTVQAAYQDSNPVTRRAIGAEKSGHLSWSSVPARQSGIPHVSVAAVGREVTTTRTFGQPLSRSRSHSRTALRRDAVSSSTPSTSSRARPDSNCRWTHSSGIGPHCGELGCVSSASPRGNGLSEKLRSLTKKGTHAFQSLSCSVNTPWATFTASQRNRVDFPAPASPWVMANLPAAKACSTRWLSSKCGPSESFVSQSPAGYSETLRPRVKSAVYC